MNFYTLAKLNGEGLAIKVTERKVSNSLKLLGNLKLVNFLDITQNLKNGK